MSLYNLTLLPERIRSKFVINSSGCWLWTAGTSTAGYGVIRRNSRNHYAHRVIYEYLVGPIPEGLVIDHLCKNPPCQNPLHMEVVTIGENVKRGTAASNSIISRKRMSRERIMCRRGMYSTWKILDTSKGVNSAGYVAELDKYHGGQESQCHMSATGY